MGKNTRDGMNQYPPSKANDQGTELIELVINFYRGRRGQFTSTEATNIGTEVTAILNGSHPV